MLLACAGPPGLGDAAPEGRVIEDVPFYPQEAYRCGPASLAGVLNYWGIGVSPDDVAEEIFSESAKGTLGLDMVFYAEDMGLRADGYAGSAEDVRRKIDSGVPLVVMVDYGFWLYQRNHFMVIVGYNGDGFIVNSGSRRHRFLPSGEFLRAWERAGNWTLAVRGK